MGSKWSKVKFVFGLNMCVYMSSNNMADNDDEDGFLSSFFYSYSDAVFMLPVADWISVLPILGLNSLKLFKSLSSFFFKVYLFVEFYLFIDLFDIMSFNVLSGFFFYVDCCFFFMLIVFSCVLLLMDGGGWRSLLGISGFL